MSDEPPGRDNSKRDIKRGLTCNRCGYDLRGLTEYRCPECGQPFDPDTCPTCGGRGSVRWLPPVWVSIPAFAITLGWAYLFFSSPSSWSSAKETSTVLLVNVATGGAVLVRLFGQDYAKCHACRGLGVRIPRWKLRKPPDEGDR